MTCSALHPYDTTNACLHEGKCVYMITLCRHNELYRLAHKVFLLTQKHQLLVKSCIYLMAIVPGPINEARYGSCSCNNLMDPFNEARCNNSMDPFNEASYGSCSCNKTKKRRPSVNHASTTKGFCTWTHSMRPAMGLKGTTL